MRLKDRVVVVTGAAGRSAARYAALLAEQGARLAVTDRQRRPAQRGA